MLISADIFFSTEFFIVNFFLMLIVEKHTLKKGLFYSIRKNIFFFFRFIVDEQILLSLKVRFLCLERTLQYSTSYQVRVKGQCKVRSEGKESWDLNQDKGKCSGMKGLRSINKIEATDRQTQYNEYLAFRNNIFDSA